MERKHASGKFPPTFVYVMLVVWVVLIIATGFVFDVKTAAYALSVSLIAVATARVTLPDGAVPRVRSKTHDAIILCSGAIAVFLLAGWGNTPPV
ncbi:hypothetical protein [Trueperella pyogenes]|uniref:hypothetical protein n=1 Tax=Trueperella pyogenes TaxID=1661 RepID=UPI00324FC853